MMASEGRRQARPAMDDLVAACNSLGSLDVNDGVYMKDSDCKACLREIARFLQTDDDQRSARIFLGKLNFLKSDLIPIIVQYCDFNDGDQDLFRLVLKIATNITSSVYMLFPETPTMPEQIKIYNQIMEGLYKYKQAFAEEPKIWHTLNTYLRNVDDDEVLFERILIFIRNILHIPVDISADLGIKIGTNSHEFCLNHMDKSGMLNTLIKLASETAKGSEFCFHIIEIVHLILKDQNPTTVANATQPGSLKRKLDENDSDKKRLLELLARDRIENEVKERNFRIPRFKQSTYQVNNLTSLGKAPMLTNMIVKTRQDISFDTNKTQLRKSKNKKPLSMEKDLAFQSDTNTTASRVTFSLKMFSKLFVEKVYANYMQQIKFNLMQKKAVENDETYYLWAINYFMPFSRHLYLDMNYISETLSMSTLHYIQVLITDYQEKLKLEKKRSIYENISQRLHQAIRAYREILLTYQFIKPDSEFHSKIEATKRTIFSEIEYNSLLLSLFKQYVPNKHSHIYVKDLINANHIYIEMIEEYFKTTEDDPKRISFFMSSYCAPEIIATYLDALRNFKTNDADLNMQILKYLQRVVYDCKNEVVLMQASVLRCLLDIHDYHSSLPGYHEFVSLTKHIMGTFRDMINKKRWMIQELLFWKTRNDVIEIENAVDPPPPPPQEEPMAPLEPEVDDELLERGSRANSIEDLMAELGSDQEDNEGVSNLPSPGGSIEDLKNDLNPERSEELDDPKSSDEMKPDDSHDEAAADSPAPDRNGPSRVVFDDSDEDPTVDPISDPKGPRRLIFDDSDEELTPEPAAEPTLQASPQQRAAMCVDPLIDESVKDLIAELNSQQPAASERVPDDEVVPQRGAVGGDSVEDLMAELDSDNDDDSDDLSSLPSCSDDEP